MNSSADVLSVGTIWGFIMGGDWVGTDGVGIVECGGMGRKFCVSLFGAGFHILDAKFLLSRTSKQF